MRKKILLSAAAMVLGLATLTGCGTKLTANSLTLELGDSVPDDILEYVTVSSGDSEDVLANATLSTEDIDNMAVGQYTATVTYGKQTVEVNVEVTDTVAPVLEAKDESFAVGDVITVEDLVDIDDYNDVTGIFIDEDGNEQETITAEEGMTVTVRVTDASDNSSELEVSPEVNDIAQLYGTWESTFDLSGMIEEELGSEFAGFHEEFDITLLMDFNEDGTFKMYADEDTLTDSFNNYIESLAVFGTELIYTQFTAEGYSRKEINSVFKQEYGMGIEEYMLSELQKSVDIKELVESIETTGVYEVEGNKLYMDEFAISSYSYDLFTIEGDVLTIDASEEVDSVDILEEFSYPYVFNRVQ